MAKSKSNSARSRAARRAASPSLDLDKSLTSLPRVEEDNVLRDSILADRANAGVTKKQSKPKAKTRAQRLRQQKGLERAEIVMDQLEVKVAGSVKRGKNVKARRADWDDLNKSNKSKFALLQEQSDDDTPNDGDDAMVDDSTAPASNSTKPAAPLPDQLAQKPVEEHAPVDEDDEIT
ncbi:hypothetical protein PHISCL_08788 [Aspergillus sclerotialis]|uniref:Ribosome biogenesis protein Alb1 n=1 Tax=Aspergillus sclerotialis TaxID=2070753 RepID=A0A3A2Z6Z4_9EURO|nr:hypothetical protein PHISCL_08788 [Aspergillus sclerotialis]